MSDNVMSSNAARSDWGNVVNKVMSGETILIVRYNKPVAAIIPYEDFVALQEQLEDLSDLRDADAAYREYLRDPSRAIPIEEAIAHWEAIDDAQEKDRTIE